MKFIADAMLGKLTRWLRILSHDVKYSNSIEDNDLITTAKQENRILLTKDLDLYRRAIGKGVLAEYIEGTKESEKIAELSIKYRFELTVNLEKSRCPKCNTRIKTVAKEKITFKVERNTLRHYTDFWECPTCSSIYWQGAHWKGIRLTLEEARKIKESKFASN